MSGTSSYDSIVIGTGQAGKPLALALAEAGRRVAVVERDAVGGSCVNYGCTPTKTMVASARIAHLARRADFWGVRTGEGEIAVDLERVRERKRRMVAAFSGHSRNQLEETAGVDLVFGHARFTAPHEVEVERRDGAGDGGDGGGTLRLTAGEIFVNTGTRAAMPEVEGIAEVPTLDNRSVMELGELPAHLLVLGGGYIGLEFGQMFRRFGSRVTVVQRGPRLLGREDPDVAEAVAEILRLEDVEVLLEAEAESAEAALGGGVRLTVRVGGNGSEAGGERRTLTGSHLLVATGRQPNTDDLGLDAAGVETDRRGFIRVDERLATGVPGIWALGDVKGGPAFTHISYDDFRIVRTNLLGGGDATTRGRLVPYTVFIDPQLGRVGMSEEEAEEAGREVRVARLPMTSVARAIEIGETRGFMKAVVDAESGRILGCAILGIEGGEVMSVVQVAMMGDLPYTALKEGVFAHPTLAESLNNLFMELD